MVQMGSTDVSAQICGEARARGGFHRNKCNEADAMSIAMSALVFLLGQVQHDRALQTITCAAQLRMLILLWDAWLFASW